jgi:hypothetical protein
MSRWSVLGLRLVLAALLICAALWGSLWAYIGHEAHRERLMLAELSQIHVGDTEASVLPLVQRYGGFKWASEPLPLSPREEWLDKDEYDYQQNRVSDYRYALQISPFGTYSVRTSRLVQAIRKVRSAVPERLRPMLGMRDWFAEGDLSVRDGHVQSVSAVTIFAARSEWLGHIWELSEGMPHHDMRQRAYAIGSGALTMGVGGGATIDNYFTPQASEEEAEAARQFNTGCLTSIKGCGGFCDVAPRALEYLKQHPNAAWNIIPPKCP